jgi:hypothetical protein
MVIIGDERKGLNSNSGIEFDIDATTLGNQLVTAISSPHSGTYIRIRRSCYQCHNEINPLRYIK